MNPLHRDSLVNYGKVLSSLGLSRDIIPSLEILSEIRPGDREVPEALEGMRTTFPSRLKIVLLCLPGLESFLAEIGCFWETKHQVRRCYMQDMDEIRSLIHWADIVWLEWANEMAAVVTRNPELLKGKRVICRIHSYEVINGYLPKIE